jgi:hypothetical protein
VTEADPTLAVADDDQSCEAEALAALHGLRDAVDVDELFDQLFAAVIGSAARTAAIVTTATAAVTAATITAAAARATTTATTAAAGTTATATTTAAALAAALIAGALLRGSAGFGGSAASFWRVVLVSHV